MRTLLALLSLCLIGCDDSADSPTASNAPPPESRASEVKTVLETETADPVTDPTDEQIRQRLSLLTAEAGADSFAILSRDEMTYVQVAGDAASGFHMEYQDGDLKKHYASDRRDFTLEEITQAFIEYRDGTIDWSRYGQWSLMDLPE